MSNEIKGMTPTLKWVNDILSFFQTEAITIPEKYRDKVIAVKELLNDDPSGLTNTILDFQINSALVNYRIESDNENLQEVLNNWLKNINSNLRGKVPVGIKALAKENFRERWKGSSNLLLRTMWSSQDGMILPSFAFFVAGEDIVVKSTSNDGIFRLGSEKYYLRNPKDESKNLLLPAGKDELIFVQRPYEGWGTLEPVPYLIRKGCYRNSKFLQLMISKGEFIVGRALEYLLQILKGSERLAVDANITYDKAELQQINQDLVDLINKKRSNPGFPTYTTQYDTQIKEYIPEYSKAINDTIYSPSEKRILASLGMIDIVQGTTSTRRESILNPKPLIAETEQGIEDFKTLLTDLIAVIIEKNKTSHPKWMNAKIKIANDPITQFMDKDLQAMFRSMYDRGALSKRTLVEVVGRLDFDTEVERRDREKKDGLEEKMLAPIIQRNEPAPAAAPVKKEAVPTSKQGVEKKNFNQALEVSLVKCLKCENDFDYDNNPETSSTNIECPHCKETLTEKDISFVKSISIRPEQSIKTEDLISLKKLEILGEQEKLLKKLNEDPADANI